MVTNGHNSPDRFCRLFQTAAPYLLAAGAIGSAVLVDLAGRHSEQHFLQFLFVLWVVAPFAALTWAHMRSKRWAAQIRITLYAVIPILTILSLVIYANVVIHPPAAKLAFPFVMVPIVSWILMVIALAGAALMSGGDSHGKSDK